MKDKQKKIVKLALIIILMLLIIPIKVSANTENDELSPEDKFLQAVERKDPIINLTTDIDLTGAGVIDVTGITINLNRHTISTTNMGYIFQGENFKIRNGTFVVKNNGSYALFIGDEGTTNNVEISNVTMTGGINIYNATNVVISNTKITGTKYYAIWCDEHGQATVKSGEFTTNGVAVIGMSKTESLLKIQGGTYKTNGKPLVLKNGDIYNAPEISGGAFDVPLDTEYCKSGYESVKLSDGTYGTCNHATRVIRNRKEATCTSNGNTGDEYCSKCGKLMETGKTIYSRGHKVVHHDRIEPTCTSKGVEEYWTCENCNKKFADETCNKEITDIQEISALGHKASEWKSDEESHWKECEREGCKAIIPDSREAHKNINEEGKCGICNYKVKTIEKPEDKEEPEQSLTDTKTNIKLEFKEDVVSKNAKLEIEKIVEGKTYEEVKEELQNVNKFMLFDIELSENGTKIQPNGKLKVNIPIPDDFDKTKLAVYRVEKQDTIKYEVKVVTIDNISYAQFETEHFSNYILAEKEETRDNPNTEVKDEQGENTEKETTKGENGEHKLDNEPKTGVNTVLFIGIALAISIIGYIICQKKMYR